MLLRALDELLRIGFLREIGGNGKYLAAGATADLLRRVVERLLAPRADRDVAAFARERSSDALTNAFTAAGDARDLALELQVHRSSSRGFRRCYIVRSTLPTSGKSRQVRSPPARAS